jgi:hypothetical protein
MSDLHGTLVTQTDPEAAVIKNLEKIDAAAVRHLLSVGYECAQLDYKLTVDFSFKNCRKREALRLIKDIVAMSNTDGGFIVFGVRDGSDCTFEPVGLKPGETDILTTERLESWLGKYVDPNIVVASITSTVDGRVFTVVRVERNSVLVPFNRPGRYIDKKGKEHEVFSEGEIAVRRGECNRRATYLDKLRFAERIRDEARRKAIAETNGGLHGEHLSLPGFPIPGISRDEPI